ncbi:hypothetical protein BC936DRAFT_139592, partial [Jimgerdemannia flammicorona]
AIDGAKLLGGSVVAVGSDVVDGAAYVGSGVYHGAKAGVSAAGEGAEYVGSGVVHGAKAVGSGMVGGVVAIGEGAEYVGSGVVHGAKAVGSGMVGGVVAIGEGAEYVGSGVYHGAKAGVSAVGEGAEYVGSGVVHGAKAVGSGVVGGVVYIGSGVVHGAEAVGSSVVHGAEAVGSGVAHGAKVVGVGAAVVGVGAGVGAYEATKYVGGGIVQGLKNIGSAVVTVGEDVVDVTKEGVSAVGKGAKYVGSGVVEGAVAVGEGAKYVGSGVVGGVVAVGEGVVDVTKEGAGAVGKGAKYVGSGVVEGVVAVGEGAKYVGSGVVGGVVAVGEGVVDVTKEGAIVVGKGAKYVGSGVVEGVVVVGEGVKNVGEGVVDVTEKVAKGAAEVAVGTAVVVGASAALVGVGAYEATKYVGGHVVEGVKDVGAGAVGVAQTVNEKILELTDEEKEKAKQGDAYAPGGAIAGGGTGTSVELLEEKITEEKTIEKVIDTEVVDVGDVEVVTTKETVTETDVVTDVVVDKKETTKPSKPSSSGGWFSVLGGAAIAAGSILLLDSDKKKPIDKRDAAAGSNNVQFGGTGTNVILIDQPKPAQKIRIDEAPKVTSAVFTTDKGKKVVLPCPYDETTEQISFENIAHGTEILNDTGEKVGIYSVDTREIVFDDDEDNLHIATLDKTKLETTTVEQAPTVVFTTGGGKNIALPSGCYKSETQEITFEGVPHGTEIFNDAGEKVGIYSVEEEMIIFDDAEENLPIATLAETTIVEEAPTVIFTTGGGKKIALPSGCYKSETQEITFEGVPHGTEIFNDAGEKVGIYSVDTEEIIFDDTEDNLPIATFGKAQITTTVIEQAPSIVFTTAGGKNIALPSGCYNSETQEITFENVPHGTEIFSDAGEKVGVYNLETQAIIFDDAEDNLPIAVLAQTKFTTVEQPVPTVIFTTGGGKKIALPSGCYKSETQEITFESVPHGTKIFNDAGEKVGIYSVDTEEIIFDDAEDNLPVATIGKTQSTTTVIEQAPSIVFTTAGGKNIALPSGCYNIETQEITFENVPHGTEIFSDAGEKVGVYNLETQAIIFDDAEDNLPIAVLAQTKFTTTTVEQPVATSVIFTTGSGKKIALPEGTFKTDTQQITFEDVVDGTVIRNDAGDRVGVYSLSTQEIVFDDEHDNLPIDVLAQTKFATTTEEITFEDIEDDEIILDDSGKKVGRFKNGEILFEDVAAGAAIIAAGIALMTGKGKKIKPSDSFRKKEVTFEDVEEDTIIFDDAGKQVGTYKVAAQEIIFDNEASRPAVVSNETVFLTKSGKKLKPSGTFSVRQDEIAFEDIPHDTIIHDDAGCRIGTYDFHNQEVVYDDDAALAAGALAVGAIGTAIYATTHTKPDGEVVTKYVSEKKVDSETETVTITEEVLTVPHTVGKVRAYVFDVFALVDWRTSVAIELRSWASRTTKSSSLRSIDWLLFASKWYEGFTTLVQELALIGEFHNSDVLFYRVLIRLLAEYDIAGVWTEEELLELNLVWHRLNLHAESAAAIRALKKEYIATTLSNASFRTLVDLARHCSVCWNANISAELFHTYNAETVYTSAATLLGLKANEIAVISSSRHSLVAARKAGFATAYVRRSVVQEEAFETDLTVASLTQLAQSVTTYLEEERKTSEVVETVTTTTSKPAPKSFFQRVASNASNAIATVTGGQVKKDDEIITTTTTMTVKKEVVKEEI